MATIIPQLNKNSIILLFLAFWDQFLANFRDWYGYLSSSFSKSTSSIFWLSNKTLCKLKHIVAMATINTQPNKNSTILLFSVFKDQFLATFVDRYRYLSSSYFKSNHCILWFRNKTPCKFKSLVAMATIIPQLNKNSLILLFLTFWNQF